MTRPVAKLANGTRKLAIATRNGRPAYENPPERIRGDMAEWMEKHGRRRVPGPVQKRGWRLFRRAQPEAASDQH